MLRWNQTTFVNTGQATTATTSVIAGPFDISGFERFALSLQNDHSAITMLNLDVQVAMEPSANVGTGVANWASIPTSTLPLPSAAGGSGALGAHSHHMTSAIENSYHWVRILGGMTATAVARFRVTIGGFTRR